LAGAGKKQDSQQGGTENKTYYPVIHGSSNICR
jgi:hypothetical protein